MSSSSWFLYYRFERLNVLADWRSGPRVALVRAAIRTFVGTSFRADEDLLTGFACSSLHCSHAHRWTLSIAGLLETGAVLLIASCVLLGLRTARWALRNELSTASDHDLEADRLHSNSGEGWQRRATIEVIVVILVPYFVIPVGVARIPIFPKFVDIVERDIPALENGKERVGCNVVGSVCPCGTLRCLRLVSAQLATR